MQSHQFPELWSGAFSAHERYATVDMERVVAFAKERGVRVVIELDVPAHAGSMCAGLPELCSWSGCPTDLQLLNPASSKTWQVLAALANETAEVFFDKVMHWGGDEVINGWAGVAHGCWTKDPKVRAWMADNRIKDDLGIYLHFADYVDQLARNRTIGGTPMHWHDYWAAANQSGVKVQKHIVHNWGGPDISVGASADGHQVVVSGGWYLDNDLPWEAMYTLDPQAGITDPAQRQRILGGEAALWSESQDYSNLNSRAWPRAAAIAERLWSPVQSAGAQEALNLARPRLRQFRCLLLRRGVAAGTVSGAPVKDAGPCGMEID
jgi:hexosaminidase